MSKARSGRGRPPAANSALRLSALRPQLDRLIAPAEPALDQLHAQLDELTVGLKPASFLPMLAGAAAALPSVRRVEFDEALSAWLVERDHIASVRDLVARHQVQGEQQEVARAWLAYAGVELAADDTAPWQPFYTAYMTENPSQSSLTVCWYVNERRQRVRGLSMLIDFEPPWHGAVKDAFVVPGREPNEIYEEFFVGWRRRGMDPAIVHAEEAKRRIVCALNVNRQQHIRMPHELIEARDLFLRYILTLPDSPSTPPFSSDDFDALAQDGQYPEVLRRNEQRLGYQTRMPDGSVARILRLGDE